MRVEEFDYQLPAELIAQEPLAQRDASRLLVLDRRTGALRHRRFLDLPELLAPGDVLVVNDSKVIPARVLGRKETGGRAEVLLVRPLGDGGWLALTRPGIRPGGRILAGGDGAPRLTIAVQELRADGLRAVLLSADSGDVDAALAHLGSLPTPPYIHRRLADPARYQTVYAERQGSIAAPTAGLHFTPRVLTALQERSIAVERLTLHIGLGTFLPVRVKTVEEHRMHGEWYTLTPESAARLAGARRDGRRLIAVGTTTTRALEASAASGELRSGSGETSLFITPGFRFRAVDGLLTNFHLPRSTLLMLVSAFAGRERVLAAYAEAVRERYRFYSFGDAMLIV